MQDKILLLDKSVERYKKIADRHVQDEDFSGALGFLFSAQKISASTDVLMRIADAYADMGLLELSNRYWYKYMHVAPKDKVSISYEELAINYYYMDNLWASGFYFHKKLETDGYISKEGLDQEILDFFSGEDFKRYAYRVVYPLDEANFALEVRAAKRALSIGGFKDAAKILYKIPEPCRTEEISGDLAIALFMSDDLDGAEEVSRASLKAHGETVTAYCNLSTIYEMKEDIDNSEFYYKKALDCRKGDSGEAYKLATCAIEREDHPTVKECLETILSERPHEISMRFFYGQALINLGDYEGGFKALKTAYRLDPTDVIIGYYVELAKELVDGVVETEKLLPLKYVKELPKKIDNKWSRKIRDLMKNPEKVAQAIKKPNVKKIIEWGMLYGSDAVMRASVFLLSNLPEKEFNERAQEFLINPDARDDTKRLLIYVLTMRGYKGKLGVVAHTFYTLLNIKKTQCEKSADGAIYYSAYALLLSKLVFVESQDYSMVAKVTDQVFKVLKEVVTDAEVNNEELAALILSECGLERLSDDKEVMNLFEISDYKLKKLQEIYRNYKGENHD